MTEHERDLVRAVERNLTGAEVAAMFRTSPETVRYWRHIGKGPRSFKVGRRVLYRESDVMAWADAALTAGTAG
jgi:predicted DNA-binding transcriptional regulator AlpA